MLSLLVLSLSNSSTTINYRPKMNNKNQIQLQKKRYSKCENSHSLCSCGARCSATMPVRHKHPTHPLLHFYTFAGCYLFCFHNFWHICEGHAAMATNKSRDKFPPKKNERTKQKTNIAIHFETQWKRDFEK